MAKISIDLQSGKAIKDSDVIIGIDLGTTNSLVAYVKDGEAVTVKAEDGKNALMPSVLHFGELGKIVVGTEAEEQLIVSPENTIFSVKRLMGKSYHDIEALKNFIGYKIIDDGTDNLVKIQVKNNFYTPIELSAHILEALKVRIEKALGARVSKAVITVPAYFNDAQRQATRDAGKLAGLDVLRIVNEPTAASLAYGIGLDPDESKTVAVYDLGGGTFDISILSIENGIFEVLATNGDTFLGGDDVDRAIVELWVDRAVDTRFNDRLEIDRNDKEKMQELRLLAKKLKEELANPNLISVGRLLDYQDEFFSVNISKEELKQIVQPLAKRTIDACKNALKDANLTTADIDSVIMVGGSTRLATIKNAVTEFFGQEVNDTLNPDEVVALGAAIQADVLAGNQKDILLLDITPLSLGIETVGGLMDVIIPRNSKVPMKAGRQYTTSIDGQKNLKIAVYQGERDLVQDNRKLGEFVLKNIPPMPMGLPKIDIQFILDADGILTVRARELRSGVEQKVEMKPAYGISEEEMALMLMDSITNAQEDMKIRALLEARNEASIIVMSAEKFIVQNAQILSETEAFQTIALTEALKNAIGGDNKDAINTAMQALNEYTMPLAHRAMDIAVKQAMAGKRI